MLGTNELPQDIEGGRILPINLVGEMKKSFISYAMAVIISRALPDVRDGLKPVHRRILYAMDELSMQPDKPFRKCARLVGDVLGKYHPHGDTAVYDATVRLAQPFSTRYPLVEGHGNFGSVDGDPAAAMRYTECRMSRLTLEMLSDLDKNTVDFYPNFDETLMQPAVLPARYPNLLVNGSNGIAVGMATNIPPHNLGETIDAFVAMIDDPDITIDELMNYIPGPDFPTGGVIMGDVGIRHAYFTGRGRILVRAKSEIEQYKADRSRIIVTEIPYQVNKAKLVEKIAELIHEKKVDGISDLRDESSRAGMRIVIELKKDVNANVVLNNLYKHTQLQDTFGVIMIALVDGEPKVLNLREMLWYYLEHQKEVVTRRTQFDLDKARERLHIIEGLIIALDNIDEVIAIIKASANGAEAKERLIARFGFSEKQAQAILDMRLQRLTGLEREKLEAEYAELKKTVEYLLAILSDEKKLLGVIRDEVLEIRRRFADPRRTEITKIIEDIDMDDIIQEEDMVVTCTHHGYIKRIAEATYRTQRRGGVGVSAGATRDEDFLEDIFVTSTHSYIMFFTNKGRAFRIKCYSIPEASRTAKGTPIVNLLQLQTGEFVTAAFPIGKDVGGGDEGYLVLCTRNGVIKKTPLSDFSNIRKGGIIAQNLREGDELISVDRSSGRDEFIIGTREGKSIRFSEEDVRAMGRAAAGVRAIKLDEGDAVVDMSKVKKGEYVIAIAENGMGKRTDEEEYRQQGRAGKGIIAMNITEKTGKLICLKVASGNEDLMLIRDDGIVIRIPVSAISVISRNTQGVRLMRIDGEHRVASVALAPHNDDEPEKPEGEEAAAPAEEIAVTEPEPAVTDENGEELDEFVPIDDEELENRLIAVAHQRLNEDEDADEE
ncbi:MAG: DNA gyrase subunit A [Clostridia bacterium]|nr:DNA gyrase subunit A [Clostridia bacterium]